MKKNKTPGQVGAMAAVVLIVLLILALLWAALFGSTRMFQALLVCAVGIPLLVWIYVWLYGVIKKKHTMASFDVAQGITGTPERESEEEKKAAAGAGQKAKGPEAGQEP